MDQIAIIKKEWEFLDKIMLGSKSIESRWYEKRITPWKKINPNDTLYFKESGNRIKIKAKAQKVVYFSDLTPQKVKEIVDKYGLLLGIENKDNAKFFERFKSKNYCILIFLKNVREIKPFNINKKGFGSMSAWLTLNDINKIRIKE